MLAALGGTNLHQRNFTLFLAVVVGLSALIAVVFVLTAVPAVPTSDGGDAL